MFLLYSLKVIVIYLIDPLINKKPKEEKQNILNNKTLMNSGKSSFYEWRKENDNQIQTNKKIEKLTLRQTIEKTFIDKSNSVFKLDKDRDIRFFSCRGNPPITFLEEEAIKNRRIFYKVKTKNKFL